MKRNTFYAIYRMIPAIILTMSAVAAFDDNDELIGFKEARGNFEGSIPWAIQALVSVGFVYAVMRNTE
jgi:hypothetical protein